MSYDKLSHQVTRLSNPQRSDTFYALLRNAVRTGKIDGADLPERFELPKQFQRRGQDETYVKTVRDMVLDISPTYEAWFKDVDASLTRISTKVAPVSLAAIESGEVDFGALVAQTRLKLQGTFDRGQALGNSRKKARSKTKTRGAARAPRR